ncbi:MAG: ATP-binding cassette domain-containing protein [Bryobacterales bacterium]|nr:ATP-binding cassette domain-containing protein [Bryobacteraceae bacterium]MDW8129649.1 ATP-binding cassette domain-containing protein [Bryobacterales bacterium]
MGSRAALAEREGAMWRETGQDGVPVLRFDRVSVSFDEVRALNDVSFRVYAGESRVILGAAGSGKTVLLKTALGLIKPDSGRVWVFGQDITEMPESELFAIRARIGVLFQEGGLFDSLTVEENVGYPLENQPSLRCPPDERRRRVEEALRFVELEHTLEKYPSELSGGMRRRVGIARAVVTEPELVLYDSPTAGLDPITAYTIIALIVKERDLRNITTIMVTHRYQDAHFLAGFRWDPATGRLVPAPAGQTRTRFMVLREGRLAFEGTRAELEASRDPYLMKFVRREG